VIVVAAYLIGSISFAVVVSKAYRLPDPHEYGSRNPGATNVLRTRQQDGCTADANRRWHQRLHRRLCRARPRAARSMLPIGSFRRRRSPCSSATSIALYHHFAGGKGVATAAGIVFALHWQLALVFDGHLADDGIRIENQLARSTRHGDLATARRVSTFSATPPLSWSMIVIAALIFWRHRANIRQLMAGTERPIGR
jgi:glycerol-3-phosphate acyltransferase PlsY